MANEFKKSPNEKIWYPVGNFDKCIADDETISTQSVKVYDGQSDVTSSIIESSSPRIDNKKVIARVIGGESDKSYQCRTLVTTTKGNEYEAVGYIKITD